MVEQNSKANEEALRQARESLSAWKTIDGPNREKAAQKEKMVASLTAEVESKQRLAALEVEQQKLLEK
jgi:hypothetical protein